VKEEGRSIYPIFYEVDPSQVRHQTGTYAEALSKHEASFYNDADNEKAQNGERLYMKQLIYEAGISNMGIYSFADNFRINTNTEGKCNKSYGS